VAHTRDYRRRKYFDRVKDLLGSEFESAEEDLDQVIYNPRRLICAPPPGDPTGEIDPALLEAVDNLRVSLNVERVAPRRLADTGARSRLWTFELPENEPIDALALASDLTRGFVDQSNVARAFPEQITPLYYLVSQQVIQPGEDPEEGQPVHAPPPQEAGEAGTLAGVQMQGGVQSQNGCVPLGAGVSIAVIDTGIDQDAVSAVQLANQRFDPTRDLEELEDPTEPGHMPRVLGPGAGHGTFIASLISLVAPGATVRSYRVAGSLGVVDEEQIADGIQRAVEDAANDGEHRTHVLNLSFGGYPFVRNNKWESLRAFPVLEAAIADIPDHIAVVAAAGNSASADKFYPAAFSTVFPNVVAVAALDRRGRLWEHSNYGDWVTACTRGHELSALFVEGDENPAYDRDGVAERFRRRPANFARWTGTSFAAPLVAAQIAILAAELDIDSRLAAEHLLCMSKPHPGPRPCGRRILVDVPGQT
jgi:subtilisin family serine protease